MKKRYDRAMTPAEIAATARREIDFADIPERAEKFWKEAGSAAPDRTLSVTLQVKKSVLDAYKAQGRDYHSRMNAVLEIFARERAKRQ